MTMMNKKAVSPLIATVLLIAFAVALGAVVMNWGRGYVEDTQDFARERSDAEVTCTTDISLDVVEIDLIKQVCANSSYSATESNITMILENRQNRDIESLNVRVISESSRVPYVAEIANDSSLEAGQARLFSFLHNKTSLGGVKQIAVTPVINLGGNDISCSANQLKMISIKECSEVFT